METEKWPKAADCSLLTDKMIVRAVYYWSETFDKFLDTERKYWLVGKVHGVFLSTTED